MGSCCCLKEGRKEVCEIVLFISPRFSASLSLAMPIHHILLDRDVSTAQEAVSREETAQTCSKTKKQ